MASDQVTVKLILDFILSWSLIIQNASTTRKIQNLHFVRIMAHQKLAQIALVGFLGPPTPTNITLSLLSRNALNSVVFLKLSTMTRLLTHTLNSPSDISLCKWTKALAKPTISKTISWDIGAFTRLEQSFCLTQSRKSMGFSFWWFLKRLTFLILTDVMRFFILYKRSECGVFLLRFVQIISYGIGNVRVMRFVTIAQSNGASCGRFAGMQIARLMKV